MIDPDQILKGLEHKLFAIPETKFVEIVHLLEQVHDHPDVRRAFETLRPRLIEMRPPRRLTLKRVFCDPFEDVLEAGRRDDASVGRIERAVIEPLWRVVEARGDIRHLAPLEMSVRHIRSNDVDGRHALGCRLWWMAAETLRNALDEAERDPGARAALLAELGGVEDRLRQARDIVEILEIGHPLTELKRRLPDKPIPALEAEDVAAIEATVKEVARGAPAKAYHVLLVVASRLRRPADLLAAIEAMDLGRAHRDKPAVFARLGALVVSSLESHSSRLAGSMAGGEDPTGIVELARHLVDSLESARAVMGSVRETAYDARLEVVRVAVREMIETSVLDTASVRILAALPDPAAAGALPVEVEEAVQNGAEAHARSLRRCAVIATPLGLDRRVEDTLKAVGKGVEKQLDRMVEGLKALPRDAEAMEIAERNIIYAVRVAEMVAGSSHADALRLKAMEALFGQNEGGGG